MRFSVITPSFNSARFLEQTINSVLEQKKDIELEYIMIDGGSTDGSIEILKRYSSEFDYCIIEPDNGPAHAINKGLRLATGDIVSWLNADDVYYPGTLLRVCQAAAHTNSLSMLFGGCRIVDENGVEIRSSISRFKEFFYPLSNRFIYQCINYISQPSLFFAGDAVRKTGFLREDMVAAWDYEYILKLWCHGTVKRIEGDPLAAFRWYEQSISGENFNIQFKEEYEVAKRDAGILSIQTMLHFLVRWGIVGIYSAMSTVRSVSSVTRKS